MVGIRVLCCKLNEKGMIDMENAIDLLYKECNILRIMVEGGASVISNLIDSVGIVDVCIITVAPFYIGGLRAFEVSFYLFVLTIIFHCLKM